jgi:hypothetical protein
MTAREKFHKGQRVIESPTYPRRYPRWKPRWKPVGQLGTVVGFGHALHVVAVVRDGARSRRAYHMDYWDPVPDVPRG